MNSLHIDENNLHHAYLIAGNKELAVPKIESFLTETLKYSLQGNPDYTKEEFVNFGVDDGHRIAAAHMKRAIAGDKKIFLISVSSFSHEAQNALLKMFEEPTENTHFFIVVPSVDILLPTLKSRLLTVIIKNETEIDTNQAKLFFKASISQRIKMLGSCIEDKNKHESLIFLNSLEHFARQIFLQDQSSVSWREFLEDLVAARGYLRDRSPSVKMLLEHLAHTAPNI